MHIIFRLTWALLGLLAVSCGLGKKDTVATPPSCESATCAVRVDSHGTWACNADKICALTCHDGFINSEEVCLCDDTLCDAQSVEHCHATCTTELSCEFICDQGYVIVNGISVCNATQCSAKNDSHGLWACDAGECTLNCDPTHESKNGTCVCSTETCPQQTAFEHGVWQCTSEALCGRVCDDAYALLGDLCACDEQACGETTTEHGNWACNSTTNQCVLTCDALYNAQNESCACDQSRCAASQVLSHGAMTCSNGSCTPVCSSGYRLDSGTCVCDSASCQPSCLETLGNCWSNGAWRTTACTLSSFKPEHATAIGAYSVEVFDRTTQNLWTCGATACEPGWHPTYRGMTCLPDLDTMCGSSREDCTLYAQEASGQCIQSKCHVAACIDGFSPTTIASGHTLCMHTQQACTTDHECEGTIAHANASDVICKSNQCQLKWTTTACADAFHRDPLGLACEPDGVIACGAWDNSCYAALGLGVKEALCENKACSATTCHPGYHKKNNTCVADSISACGSETIQCIAGPNQEAMCSRTEFLGDPICTTACRPGYHASGTQCVEDLVTACGVEGVACSATSVANAHVECVMGGCAVVCNTGYAWSSDNTVCIGVDYGVCPHHNFTCAEAYGAGAICESGVCKCSASLCACGNGVCNVTDGENTNNCAQDCTTGVAGHVYYHYHNRQGMPYGLRVDAQQRIVWNLTGWINYIEWRPHTSGNASALVNVTKWPPSVVPSDLTYGRGGFLSGSQSVITEKFVFAASTVQPLYGVQAGHVEIISNVSGLNVDIMSAWGIDGTSPTVRLDAISGSFKRLPLTSPGPRDNFSFAGDTWSPSFDYKNDVKAAVLLPNQRVLVLILSNDLNDKLTHGFLGNYYLRVGFLNFLRDALVGPPHEIMWVPDPPESGAQYRIDATSGSRIQGISQLLDLKNLESGASLHELMHRWGNGMLPPGARSSSANTPTLPSDWIGYGAGRIAYQADFTHWGFISQLGQLGGFPEAHLVQLRGNPSWAPADMHPASWFTLRSFGGNFFGTHTGNNQQPGRYSDLEMFLAGLAPAPARIFVSQGSEQRLLVTAPNSGPSVEVVGHNGFHTYVKEDLLELRTFDNAKVTNGGLSPETKGWKGDCAMGTWHDCSLNTILVYTTTSREVSLRFLLDLDAAMERFSRRGSNGLPDTYNIWEATQGRAYLKTENQFK